MFIISIILFIIAGVIFVIGKFGADDKDSAAAFTTGSIAVGLIGSIFLLLSCFYVIDPGEIGLEVRLGKIVDKSENGFHVKNPISSVSTYDCRTIKEDHKCEGMSQDMQAVNLEVAINYRVDFQKITDLYQKVGLDYSEKVIQPALQQAVKQSVSKFRVEDITVHLEEVRNIIENILMANLSNYFIILQNVNLVDIDFSQEFNAVVEQKQIEEQKIKTAEYQRMQAEQQKQTTILQAQAEAEKQRLLRDSVSEKVVQLKWIEAWEKGGSKVPMYIGGSKGGEMFMMNMTNQ